MMSKYFISVAMCTYNGAQYLKEQLDSIVKQTRLPNEVVVCDDGSIDATLQLLDKFKEITPFSVRIYRNKTNLGPTKNFEEAISLCRGDIIVLSDQDDIWVPYKLETLERAFEKYSDIGYIFSNAWVVDKKSRFVGDTIWNRISFTIRDRSSFKKCQLEFFLDIM